MDSKKIRSYIHDYYVRGGEVYSFTPHEIVEDEQTRIEVMLSVFLYEEARKRHKENNTDVVALDEILDRLLVLYGINGAKNELPENKLVWNIITSEGHIEEEFVDESATGNKYQLLTGPNKALGLAVLRYIARKEGFDIENLEITVDASNFQEKGTSKITIDFTKGPILEKRPRPATNFKSTAGKETETVAAQEQLRLAQESGNEKLIKYWEDVLAGKKPKPYKPETTKKKSGVLEHLEETRAKVASFWQNMMAKRNESPSGQAQVANNQDISYIDSQIEEARKNNDTISEKYWTDMKNIVLGTAGPAPAPQPAPSASAESTPTDQIADPNLVYAQSQLEEARKYNDEEGIRYWENMIRLSDPKIQKDLAYAKEQLEEAIAAQDDVMTEFWQNTVNTILTGQQPALQENDQKNGPAI